VRHCWPDIILFHSSYHLEVHPFLSASAPHLPDLITTYAVVWYERMVGVDFANVSQSNAACDSDFNGHNNNATYAGKTLEEQKAIAKVSASLVTTTCSSSMIHIHYHSFRL
jgi:hypothetical protein